MTYKPPALAGKSMHMAALAAAHIKAGRRVILATKDGMFPIVGVPGFDDGRQIIHAKMPRSQNSDSDESE